jgi:hypothetical protein
MFRRIRARGDPSSRAEQFRLVHEHWLNRAIASSSPIPRIPVKKVDENGRGGFDRLRARPGGLRLAERWWSLAIAIADGLD